MQPDILKYWLALNAIDGIGPAYFSRLQKTLGSIELLFHETSDALASLGLNSEIIQKIKTFDWNIIDKELAWGDEINQKIITIEDTHYPALLKQIHVPPPVLYVKGYSALLNQPQIAIVGSRNPTSTGLELSYQFAETLSDVHYAITSGLALGIDSAAHQGALSNNGKTIAVLGNGLGMIYPKRNLSLSEKILNKEGAIISEFSLHKNAHTSHFPRRNRIISGLSLGVLVVEATIHSGSLITAKFAMEQNREVFALPSSIRNPFAEGCHRLIQQGAKLVQNAQDILEELPGFTNTHHKITSSHSLHSPLLKHIGFEFTAFERILERSRFSAGELSQQLLSLELAGVIEQSVAGYRRLH